MNKDFAQLEIDGSIIGELKIVPSRKIVMTLLVSPKGEAENLVQTEHDLQFNQVECFAIMLTAEPWLQVLSHGASKESAYLSDALVKSKSDPELSDFIHFEIVCVQGRVDIVAKTFAYSLFNEIPYVNES